MKANLGLVRRVLESQLKEAAPTRGLRESIRIHQVADPLDMTQQAAEREVAVLNLDRDTALARRLRSAIERLNDLASGLLRAKFSELDAVSVLYSSRRRAIARP